MMEVEQRHSEGSSRSSDMTKNMEAIRSGKMQFEASQTKQRVKKKQSTWWKDPEAKRQRRIAKYKFYAVEGRLKHSLNKGFKWIKNKCAKIISGF